MKRNGKKSRVITSALVLSVVLFLSVNTFCSMFQEVNQMTGKMPYQLYVATPETEKKRLYTDLAQIDGVAQTEMMASTILIMQVFIYGFITLMTLISVANIFNTVSTGIDLRRKEFAMLKSVGVTPKGFRRMLRFESLFYGLKALMYGLPLSLGISILMWKALADGFTLAFHPDWRIYLGVIVAVFFITGISMAYATSKVKKDSIIETLKSEIN